MKNPAGEEHTTVVAQIFPKVFGSNKVIHRYFRKPLTLSLINVKPIILNVLLFLQSNTANDFRIVHFLKDTPVLSMEKGIR